MLKELLIGMLHGSGLHRLFHPLYGGHTTILMLHRVTPGEQRGLPTDALALTPEFLERFIRDQQTAGWRFISLDYLVENFSDCVRRRRNMVVTLDDGYRDNLEYARPIFSKLGVPYTIYVTNSFPDGTADLWWYTISNLLAVYGSITLVHRGAELLLSLKRPKQSLNAFKDLYERLRREEQLAVMADLTMKYPLPANTDRLWLKWDEIRELAGDSLCSIGCHTFNHLSLGTLSRETARDELLRSKLEIEAQISRPVRHLAYPYGKRGDASVREAHLAVELGFKSAVTTRIGNLFEPHANHLLMLPRIPLYQGGKNGQLSDLFLSGMYTAFANRFKRVVTD